MDIGAEKIKEWHTKGNGWSDIGYHWVIRRDGTLDKGRDEVVVSDCIFTGLRMEERMGTRARHVAEALRDAYGLSPKGELPQGKGEKHG